MSIFLIPEGSTPLMTWSLARGASYYWSALPNGKIIDLNRPKNRAYLSPFTAVNPKILVPKGNIHRVDVQASPSMPDGHYANVSVIRTKENSVIGWTDAPYYITGVFYYDDDWIMTNPFDHEISLIPARIMEDTREYLEAVAP